MPNLHDRPFRSANTIRGIALVMVLAFVALLPAPEGPAVAPAQAQSAGQTVRQGAQPLVIGAKCRQCHKEVVESFALDAHGKSAKFLNDSRTTTCEKCHGDGEKHNASTLPQDIINPPNLTKREANESCLQCHSRDRTHHAWRGGPHDRKDISCLSCHSAHHSKSEDNMLTRRTDEETCLSCHNDRRADFFKRSTHLFRTELRNQKVGCASCHNPHGGEGPKMLTNHSVNGLCYTCHAEKRGPYLWDHPPVRENCLNCHSPHGSNNAKLLTARAHMVCQQCHIHMLPRHSTTAGKPLDIWSLNRGCVTCHAQIHGSNHPGGRTLGR